MRRWRALASIVVGLSCVGLGTSAPSAHAAGPHAALGIQVSGNRFVNSRGQTVRLLGFNNSGAEYACIEGWGIFDTDRGSDTSVPTSDVRAMARWSGANAVRIQLNEQCWLGIGGVKSRYGGRNYQHAIQTYVRQLTNRGFAVILNLHLSAPGNEASINQEAMPDAHSITFWSQVATAFRSNTAVVFDLFNEPWPDHQSHSAKAWTCWRDGGCRVRSENGGETYRAVGMNQLIDAVRSAGAHNVVLAGGVNYASALGRWLHYQPTDPDHNLAASIHLYSFNGCNTTRCYNRTPAKIARHVPLYIGEFGPDLTVGYSSSLDSNCPSKDVGHTGFDSALVHWARRNGASWTAWSWNPWGDCWSLVTGFSGHPTSPYGERVRKALRANRQTHPA
jgi:endoglucanase